MPMSIVSNRSLLILYVFAGIATFNFTADGGEKKGTKPDIGELVKFEVRIQPEDPFDPRNAVSFKGDWKIRRGQVIRLELHAKLTEGWNSYPITQRTSVQDPGQLSKWEIEKTPGIQPLWPLYESSPKIDTLNLGKNIRQTYFKFLKTFMWGQDVLIEKDAPTGSLKIPIKLTLQICKGTCFTYSHVVPVTINVSDEEPESISDDIERRLKQAKP